MNWVQWLPIIVSACSLVISAASFLNPLRQARRRGRAGERLTLLRRGRDDAEAWVATRGRQYSAMSREERREFGSEVVTAWQACIDRACELGALTADAEKEWLKLGGLPVDDGWHEKGRELLAETLIKMELLAKEGGDMPEPQRTILRRLCWSMGKPPDKPS
jgi:hypothetical protein